MCLSKVQNIFISAAIALTICWWALKRDPPLLNHRFTSDHDCDDENRHVNNKNRNHAYDDNCDGDVGEVGDINPFICNIFPVSG